LYSVIVEMIRLDTTMMAGKFFLTMGQTSVALRFGLLVI
jgi:hypothetical protein